MRCVVHLKALNVPEYLNGPTSDEHFQIALVGKRNPAASTKPVKVRSSEQASFTVLSSVEISGMDKDPQEQFSRVKPFPWPS